MPDKPPTRAPKAANMLSGSTISDPPPDRTGDVAVVINGLNKHFGGAPALQDLSAQIRYGRLTGLVGPDGAGKTTLMRILTGLLVPSSGRATVAGFRSEEHTSELQSLMRISYAVFCLKKKTTRSAYTHY